MQRGKLVHVGLTEGHGVALELVSYPPSGVQYSFVGCIAETPWWITSPIGGFLRKFDSDEHDLIDAVLCPALTKNPWICTLANFQEAMSFRVLGVPTPRTIKRKFLEHLFRQPNFKGLVFWSQAGLRTLSEHGRVTDRRILEKARVIYPAVARVKDELLATSKQVKRILFTGDFFRKGGVNVVEAFLRLYPQYPEIQLVVCSSPEIDFRTSDGAMRAHYLSVLQSHPAITLVGRVPRERLCNEILPKSDVYVMPTYADTFGFAVLEAMAYGIPVVTTNVFAIPEIVDDGNAAAMIDVSAYPLSKIFRGYTIDSIPDDLRRYLTEQVYCALGGLISDTSRRLTIREHGLTLSRTKFDADRRNAALSALYAEALAGG